MGRCWVEMLGGLKVIHVWAAGWQLTTAGEGWWCAGSSGQVALCSGATRGCRGGLMELACGSWSTPDKVVLCSPGDHDPRL
ncbi:hypothetical protein HaLaN_30557 [Haematococcus lacustris]|uniref:Uncharacterized protein n=1 Tax=Haematococcus lacustris TaxID=44745 RepID=A0A6A0AI11_HAELA|nr:hypothetical protein HaLaN_30557 [Haematococcus lacustris]